MADVEVVRNGEVIEAGGFHEEFRGDRVGDVEGEIADFFQVVAVLVIMECAEVAEKQAVGFGFFDEFEIADFAGLEDARGGEKKCGARSGECGSEEGDGLLVAAGVFEIAVDRFHAAIEGGGDLAEGAAKDGEMGRTGFRCRDGWKKIAVSGSDHRMNRLDRGGGF